jgi:DNA-binding transcriptional MerR regulator
MPAPYSIEETAAASGLSVKFIRRMRQTLPELFERYSERGAANALYFSEELLEVLKRTRQLRDRGRTLQQIRDEFGTIKEEEKQQQQGRGDTGREDMGERERERVKESTIPADPLQQVLERENELLRSQVTLLQHLLERADERFDRLLPAAQTSPPLPPQQREGGRGDWRNAMLRGVAETAIVTLIASGSIFLLWFLMKKLLAL